MRPKTLIAIFALLGCSLLFAASKVGKEGKAWLDGFSAAPEASINGVWNAAEWGTIKLEQAEGQREVSGTGDAWRITGVVSAKTAYLLFAYKNGNIAYSAILTNQGADSWSGEYYNELLKRKRDKMVLIRASSESKK